MKTIVAVWLFLLGNCSLMAAQSDSARYKAKESFAKQYPGAQYMQWESLSEAAVYLVRFVYERQAMVAYYDENGTGIGFARVIMASKLPVKVKNTIDGLFTESSVLGIQELMLEDKHLFYFDVVSRHKKIFVVVHIDGTIKQIRKG